MLALRLAPVSVLLLAACAPVEAPITEQPPILAWLVVHVDPLPRQSEGDCLEEAVTGCGALKGETWRDRTENLVWLTDRWIETGRTMDLELGPEAALGWAEDPEVTASLVATLEEAGDEDAATTAAETVATGRASISALVSSGAASLGVHVHDIVPDAGGLWGAVYLNLGEISEEGSPEVCTTWEEDPLAEPRADVIERVVAYGVNAADAIAAPLGAPLESFTGHLPRSMSGKITVVEDVEALDPENVTGFPERFAPTNLGSAYSECLTVALDHQPFEAWPADEIRALAAGDGPPVVPGARVVGSLSEHLGVPADGSLGADARRLLQAVVNWRYAGLMGEAPRPWVFTFHTHLFDLYPGAPNADIALERGLRPQLGQKFRKDLDAFAGLIDAFEGKTRWQGMAQEGGVTRWALPRDVDAAGSAFSYSQEGEAPPEAMDREAYPYLPLVAERLSFSHLGCTGEMDGVELYGMMRCEAGWAWGDDQSGYHCADGAASRWVYLLIPEGPTCLEMPSEAALFAPVDGEAMGGPTRCGDGVEVPVQGLLVEPAEGAWWSATCAPWG